MSLANETDGTLPWRTIDQLAAERLVVPFTMVMSRIRQAALSLLLNDASELEAAVRARRLFY